MLVTGGAGFIGANFVRRIALHHPDARIVVLDSLTYAGDAGRIQGVRGVELVVGNICDGTLVRDLLISRQLGFIIHFAAESHVDRSIRGPAPFIQTNLVGTFSLLEAAREAWGDDSSARFIHVSTDEVYGSIEIGQAQEGAPYAPNNPYSASKAGSDHLARAYHRTYGLPVLVTHCTNNFGPFQHPEKLIPSAIACMARNEPVPIYGNGQNIRNWLFVEDHCAALELVLAHGIPGEAYGISGDEEYSNLDLLTVLANRVDLALGRLPGTSSALFEFVPDRPGHDHRYALSSTRIRDDFGWCTTTTLLEGMDRTIMWYLKTMDL